MELRKLLHDLRVVIEDDVTEAVHLGCKTCTPEMMVDDGCIFIECYSETEKVVVSIYDNDGEEKDCPLLCRYLENMLNRYYFWSDVRERSVNPNPGLDLGFSSWEDYYQYKCG